MEFNQTNNNQGDVNNVLAWAELPNGPIQPETEEERERIKIFYGGKEIKIGHPNVSSAPLKAITLWYEDTKQGPMTYHGLLDFLILVYPENENTVYRTVGTDTPEKQMALSVLLGDTVAAKMLADKLTNGE